MVRILLSELIRHVDSAAKGILSKKYIYIFFLFIV